MAKYLYHNVVGGALPDPFEVKCEGIYDVAVVGVEVERFVLGGGTVKGYPGNIALTFARKYHQDTSLLATIGGVDNAKVSFEGDGSGDRFANALELDVKGKRAG